MSKGTAHCKLCKETPVPDSFGSPRRCAFDTDGVFTPDNWNCVTANELRSLAGEDQESDSRERLCVRRDDQTYAAMYIPPNAQDIPDGEDNGPFRGGGFLAMSWYKNRGCTEIMIRVDPRDGGQYPDAGLPLILAEAEAALENLKSQTKESE